MFPKLFAACGSLATILSPVAPPQAICGGLGGGGGLGELGGRGGGLGGGLGGGGGGLGELGGLGGRGRGGATRQTPIGSTVGSGWTAVQVASPQQSPEGSHIVPSKVQVSTHSGGGLGGGGGLGDGGRGSVGVGSTQTTPIDPSVSTAVQVASPQQTPEGSKLVKSKEQVSTHAGGVLQTPIGFTVGSGWTAVQVASPQQTPEASQLVKSKEHVSTHCGGLGRDGGGGLGGGLGRRGRGGGLGCGGGGGAFVVLIVAVSDTLSYLNVTDRSVSNVSAAHSSTRN